MVKLLAFIGLCALLVWCAGEAEAAQPPPPYRLHLAKHLKAPVLNTPTEIAAKTEERVDEIRAGWKSWKEDFENHQEALRATEILPAESNGYSGEQTFPSSPGSGGVDWDAIAACESGGDWHIDSTYDGGLQFHPTTWTGYGGGEFAPYAWMASREQQIVIAERVLAGQGIGAWPICQAYA